MKKLSFFKSLSIKVIAVLTVISLFLSAGIRNAQAVDFDAVPVLGERQQQIWKSINLTITESPQYFTAPIVSFDVSDDGDIAIATGDKKILLFDYSGKLIRSFSFNDDGSYYIKWKGKNLLLIFVRGGDIVEFSLQCELISIHEVDEESINSTKAWNELRRKTTHSYNNKTYEIKNNMGSLNIFTSGTYSQLISTDKNGDSVLLYDVSQNHSAAVIIIVCFFLMIFGVGIAVPLVIIKKRKNRQLMC